MKKIAFLLLLISSHSNAGWAAFVRITPENMNEYKLDISFEKVLNQNKYLIKFDDPNIKVSRMVSYKTAWLVLAKDKLTEKQQDHRKYLGTKSIPENILSVSKISEEFNWDDQRTFSVLIDYSIINRSYIYVGTDQPVNDGGLFYSIDLSAFYTEYSNANKKFNKD